MDKLNDIALVAQVVMFDNKRAFDTLVRKYQSRVRKFFLAQTLGDVALSDDLAQDTFLKAYVKLSSFHGQASFGTWVFRIACNVYYDHVRSLKPMDGLDDSVSAQRAVASSASNAGLKMDLLNALAKLTEVQRTCITMQLIDGRPIDEIADIVGLKANTVKSHLLRGKAVMVAYLKENGYG